MVALKDITGGSFWRLKVVRRADNSRGGKARWLCLCECGREATVIGSDLRRGGVRSCGCLQREAAMAFKDLSEQRFGMLVAVRREGNIRDSAAWLCRCDCGAERTYSADILSRGSAGSCGCARISGAVVRPAWARSKQAASARRRRRTDAGYKISADMRRRVHETLRSKGVRKDRPTFHALGYGRDELIARLKATMPDGYSWDDYLSGLLHIDHIRPLVSFAYASVDDDGFRAAWALTNLQLLPALENIRKGAQYSEDSTDTSSKSGRDGSLSVSGLRIVQGGKK